jgi:hypothetical protein
MMKTSTKLAALGVTSLLGVALAAGAAHAATGALSVADEPGQVLQVTGVEAASAQANAAAMASAKANATGLPVATTAPAKTAPPAAPAARAATHAPAPSSVRQVARPAPQMLPAYHEVMHSGAHSWSGMTGYSGMMR